jgi:hypothetical protein
VGARNQRCSCVLQVRTVADQWLSSGVEVSRNVNGPGFLTWGVLWGWACKYVPWNPNDHEFSGRRDCWRVCCKSTSMGTLTRVVTSRRTGRPQEGRWRALERAIASSGGRDACRERSRTSEPWSAQMGPGFCPSKPQFQGICEEFGEAQQHMTCRSGQRTAGTFSTELNKTVNGADNSADIADGTPGQKGGAQLQ